MRKHWLTDGGWLSLELDLTITDIMEDLDPGWLPPRDESAPRPEALR